MVLLHGFPASSFMFREVTPAAAGRYHLITPTTGLRACPIDGDEPLT